MLAKVYLALFVLWKILCIEDKGFEQLLSLFLKKDHEHERSIVAKVESVIH